MTAQQVEAVWCWRFNVSAFRATYGRVRGTTYSKDFLQVSGQCSDLMRSLIGLPDEDDKITVALTWPGGIKTANLRRAADYGSNGRLYLRWDTDEPPAPWQLTETPSSTSVETIPGTPGLKDETDADAQFHSIDGKGIGPWLVAVKLAGEDGVLHIRAYQTSPEPGMEPVGLDRLPGEVRQCIASLPLNQGCASVETRGLLVRAPAVVRRVLSALQDGPNVLLTGPPGTGKTVALEDLRGLYAKGGSAITFDPGNLRDPWGQEFSTPTGEVRAVVFHPSYGYEDLVLGLLPEPSPTGAVGVRVQPGPLVSLAHYASQPGKSALLIIDEFNRGNAAAIFGDTLALLDGDKRSTLDRPGSSIDRQFPHLTVKVPPEFSKKTDGDDLPGQLTFPASLSIVAAMNSSDRSVAPLDAALRRRFSLITVDPDYDILRRHYEVDPGMSSDPVEDWGPEEVLRLAASLLERLNERIEMVSGRDFLLGHAHLWGVSGADRDEAARSLARAFDERIVGTLRMSFTDHDEALAAVLRAGTPDSPDSALGVMAHWVTPSADLQHVAAPRLRIDLVQDLGAEGAIGALQSLM